MLLKPCLQIVPKAQAAPEGKNVLFMGVIQVYETAFAFDAAGAFNGRLHG